MAFNVYDGMMWGCCVEADDHRGERFIQGRQLVRIEIVHHQYQRRRLWVLLIDQLLNHMGEVESRPSLRQLDQSLIQQQLEGRE